MQVSVPHRIKRREDTGYKNPTLNDPAISFTEIYINLLDKLVYPTSILSAVLIKNNPLSLHWHFIPRTEIASLYHPDTSACEYQLRLFTPNSLRYAKTSHAISCLVTSEYTPGKRARCRRITASCQNYQFRQLA